jgi:hypothetical protein
MYLLNEGCLPYDEISMVSQWIFHIKLWVWDGQIDSDFIKLDLGAIYCSPKTLC